MTLKNYFKHVSINKIFLLIIILLSIANLSFLIWLKTDIDKKFKIEAKNKDGEIISLSLEDAIKGLTQNQGAILNEIMKEQNNFNATEEIKQNESKK